MAAIAIGIAGLRKHDVSDPVAMRLEAASKARVAAGAPAEGQCAAILEPGAFALVMMGVLNPKVTGPMLQPLWAATDNAKLMPRELRAQALDWFETTLPQEHDGRIREVIATLRRADLLVFTPAPREDPINVAPAPVPANASSSPVADRETDRRPPRHLGPFLALGALQAISIVLLMRGTRQQATLSTDILFASVVTRTNEAARAVYDAARANQTLLLGAAETALNLTDTLINDSARCEKYLVNAVGTKVSRSFVQNGCRAYLDALANDLKAPLGKWQGDVRGTILPKDFDKWLRLQANPAPQAGESRK